MLEVGGSIPSPPTTNPFQMQGWGCASAAPAGTRSGYRDPLPRFEVLSREEIAKLENTARNGRDKLIIRVLVDTGVRVPELCGLRTRHLMERDHRRYLRVRGKGDKDRLVPFRSYREGPRDSSAADPFSVSSADCSSASPAVGRRRVGLADTLRSRADASLGGGFERRVYPHLLRHSFATWQLSRGMNPILLADLLGRSRLVMIHRVYAHLTPSDAYEAIVPALRTESTI
jgi:integrase